ncbi:MULTISPECIES: UDP-N-acetylmuramate dehydrogenase [Amniculibacterium]|uniref:UDP-N-acetylmuramate dehydrogenase n=1 Tax=Amniculibacterium TaxID=2715289 RepID=UPI000F5AE7CA|nr:MULTISPECIES: UDP-N-acetylmuramate dehydrogenase [Amniculibacterium]
MKIHENYPLKSLNTFGVDVTANYFAEVSTVEDLRIALDFAEQNSHSTLFLGGGSNVLFTKNYNGLVVKLNLKGISEKIISESEVLVSAQAGENWHEFVQFCLQKNYGGLENLSLIPGNVGTCPMQNIGAYGVEIKDVLHSCKALNLKTKEIVEFTNAECNFGYRDSIFKTERKGDFVLLEVCFKLTTKNHIIHSEYGAIKSELEKMNVVQPTIQQVSEAVIAIRQSKLPNPKEIGNAGSFFKNPTISEDDFERLKQEFPTIPGYPNASGVKLAAGWLIEQAGWKGKQIGNVASHHLQALVLVNKTGLATGKEIYDFSSRIIEDVKEKFSVQLEREVNIV